MAEDNIKKQNDEQLNDEQLDKVAGGRRPHNIDPLEEWFVPFSILQIKYANVTEMLCQFYKNLIFAWTIVN